MVSGAVAELSPEDVVIYDGKRKYTVGEAGAIDVGEQLAHKGNVERKTREKIEHILSHIRGVVVDVHAEVDMTRKETTEEAALPDKSHSLESKISNRERTTQSEPKGGVPGVLPNTGASITTASAAGDKTSETEKDTELDTFIGKSKTHSLLAPGAIKRINATINIPRSFFVRLYKLDQGENAEEPTTADLEPIMTSQIEVIKKQVIPMTEAEEQGTINVAMVYDIDPLTRPHESAPAGIVSELMANGLIKNSSIVILALASLAFMLLAVKKVGQQPEMPSAAELAGIPPNLPDEEELIGEAPELKAKMTGMEVNDNLVENRQVLDQISEMIKANPTDMANVIGHVIRNNE